MPPLYVGREELDERVGSRLRGFLREIMAAIDAEAAHVPRPFPPGCQGIVGFGRDATSGAPDGKHGASDLAPGRAVCLVMGEIGRAAGAVVFAHCGMRTGS